MQKMTHPQMWRYTLHACNINVCTSICKYLKNKQVIKKNKKKTFPFHQVDKRHEGRHLHLDSVSVGIQWGYVFQISGPLSIPWLWHWGRCLQAWLWGCFWFSLDSGRIPFHLDSLIHRQYHRNIVFWVLSHLCPHLYVRPDYTKFKHSVSFRQWRSGSDN